MNIFSCLFLSLSSKTKFDNQLSLSIDFLNQSTFIVNQLDSSLAQFIETFKTFCLVYFQQINSSPRTNSDITQNYEITIQFKRVIIPRFEVPKYGLSM